MIRFQKRNFDIFATITYKNTEIKHPLWFAFKKGTLIYLQQSNSKISTGTARCDSLSKKELWYICNNKMKEFKQYDWLWFAFKKGTLIYLQQSQDKRLSDSAVVIRFQKRNFDIFATMEDFLKKICKELWFAFKKGTLIYLQQLGEFNINPALSCDSLSKKELWYICNNIPNKLLYLYFVVIRFQKRNFDIFATMQLTPNT